MEQSWSDLTDMTHGKQLRVKEVEVVETGISIRGNFKLPSVCELSLEDQIFVGAFIQCHGSIKKMEKYFGVSYPSIKNRLNRLGEKFEFVKIDNVNTKSDILEQIDRGEIDVEEALSRLEK